MQDRPPVWLRLYESIILLRAKTVLLCLLALLSFFAFWIKDFRLDASSDSLVLEHDDDIQYYRSINGRYESGEYVFVTYSPSEDLFSSPSLGRLKQLRDELRSLPRVSSVVTLLDVPLLKNPPGSFKDLKDNIKTLESGEADLKLAISEFRDSPIYSNLIVSGDLRTTALQVNFRREEAHNTLLIRRSALTAKKRAGVLSPAEAEELTNIEVEHRGYKDRLRADRHQDVAKIRSIIDRYRSGARLFLGGVPMIVDDILSFIRSDLKFFGLGMFCFLVLALGMIFREKRWVLLPMLCCGASAMTMMGFLGLLRWDVTVVSSNFVSLQLIFTMSLAIHIVVRYRELLGQSPNEKGRILIRNAVGSTFVPCLYASLTTVAGFASLVVCDILPVVNFGWMMSVGLIVSLVVTFLILPTVLMLMPKPRAKTEKDFGLPITTFFAGLTERYGAAILIVSVLVAVLTAAGILQLKVENSFIDYFKESTEIYQGMKFIDRELGGTTPLDVMIEFPEVRTPEPVSPVKTPPEDEDDFGDFGEFEEKEADPSKYWFTASKLEQIRKIHDYMEGLEATGKVLSLSTLEKTTRDMNGGKPLDDFTLALLFGKMPQRFKGVLIDPYVSIENNQARVTARIKDSLEGLRRDALLKQIRSDLSAKLGLPPERFRLTGLMVLYNNMLQSLFRSQIQTIGYTVLALLLMFLVLFRSLQISLIALFPNLLASMTILGVMGLGDIPLDVMTITIVAISVGIAVDNTIHYLHRFEQEIRKDRNYLKTMHRCHRSIGNAMFYTSFTITVGFSILGLSNFIPTILFGLLTALAMIAALVASLTLLPKLIMIFKPFGPQAAGS